MSTATDRSYSALATKTNQYLDAFHQHPFKASEIKAQAPLRPPNPLSQSTSNTENLTRYTDYTNQTGLSDSGLVLDPDDREKTDEDLVAFKKLVSSLKFAYLESNLKLSFAGHIMAKDGPVLISMHENDAKERERVSMKEELRARKREAVELEALIRAEAERLEGGLDKSTRDAQHAAKLLRECEQMELEITMLRNKRTPVQRITIAEAEVLCDEQLAKLAECGPGIKACEREAKAVGQRIRAHKSGIEKLAVVKRGLRKEVDEREAKGKRDERAEEGCRWITSAMKLYESLLGIKGAYSVGKPATEMRIEFDSPHGNEGDFRTLAVALGAGGEFTGARLVDSSDDIQDIVRAFVPSQDLTSLVLEVRARISR